MKWVSGGIEETEPLAYFSSTETPKRELERRFWCDDDKETVMLTVDFEFRPLTEEELRRA